MQKLIVRNTLKKSVLRIGPSTSATKSASSRSITPITSDTVKKSVLPRQSMSVNTPPNVLSVTPTTMLHMPKSVRNTLATTMQLTRRQSLNVDVRTTKQMSSK